MHDTFYMSKAMTAEEAAVIVNSFAIYGEFEEVFSFGGGHINDTFRSQWNQAGKIIRYTHQRINQRAFNHPNEVMENIEKVTSHIRAKLIFSGEKDWSRRVLTVVPSRDGKPYFKDNSGSWWRTYLFIEDAHTKDSASSPEEAFLLGASIGRFQKQLSDLPPPRLHDTIPHFHDMENRYKHFYEVLDKDPCGRVANAKAEIEFMQANEERGAILVHALRDGLIPERICHNDTKINNILIDDKDLKPLCVIDLDTVMPGTSLYDVGDLIRTVPTLAAEDERDISKVGINFDIFSSLLEGYLFEALGFLTRGEISLIAESGRNLTHLMGLRFLTDYLEGDPYYHISREQHNLDRSRNQIALIRSLDGHWDEALQIVKKLAGS